jgi:hypothetical protein
VASALAIGAATSGGFAMQMSIDPVAAYAAAGTAATTTGTITASSTSLVVASASGWSIGMGIAVAGAGVAGVELVTSIASVSGTTLVLTNAASISVANAVVSHDDTAALSAAIAAAVATGVPIWLRNGVYNVTSALTPLSMPVSIRAQSISGVVIQNRGSQNSIFLINYQLAGGSDPIEPAAYVGGFSIRQAAGIVPTAGNAITIASASGTGYYVTGLRLDDIVINDVWCGLKIGAGQISNWINRLYINHCVSGSGIYYDSPSPSGDDHINDVQLNGYNTALTIVHADTTEFTNLKTNYSGVVLAAAAAGDIVRVRFLNPSIEGNFAGTPLNLFDFGANGCTQVSILGGGLGGSTHAFNNLAGNIGGFVLTNNYCGGDGQPGFGIYQMPASITISNTLPGTDLGTFLTSGATTAKVINQLTNGSGNKAALAVYGTSHVATNLRGNGAASADNELWLISSGGVATGGSKDIVLTAGGYNQERARIKHDGALRIKPLTFATLPTSPVAGDEVNISDSNVNTWGSTPTASGSYDVKLRYSGTAAAWTVVGI